MSALGSLVVKLALEYAQFTGGLERSEQAALQHADRVQATFDGLKGRIAGVAGAIAGGLAAAFTIDAFKSLIGNVVETGAALDDLAKQTGSTVEALSGLAAVGKYNDMSAEAIGQSMNKLTAQLAGAKEGAGGTAAGIKALGLDLDGFKKLKPEEQMQAVAKALDGFQDGAGKSAVMMALFGEQGAKMLPFMSDLASVGELQAKVTTEQAAAAANLDDNWGKLTTTGSGVAKEIATGMIPALDQTLRAALDVITGTGGMRDELRRLVADGSIERWTKTAITGLSYVADAGALVWRTLQSVGRSAGGVVAAIVEAVSGNWSGARQILVSLGEDTRAAFNAPMLGAQFRESLGKVSTAADAASNATEKAKLNFENAGTSAGKSAGQAAKLAESGADLAKSLLAQDSGLSGDFQKKWDSLSAAYKSGAISLDILTSAQAALLAQQPAMKAAQDEAIKAAQAGADARSKEADGIADWLRAQEQAAAQSLAAVRGRITGLQDEDAALAISRAQNVSMAEAVEQLTIARMHEAQATKFFEGSEGWLALQKEIDARKELLGLMSTKAVREKEYADWADIWGSIDKTAHDTFTNIFEGGQSAFTKLRDTLKATLLDLLYQMTIKKWIFNIGASVTGGMGMSGAASAATSLGSSGGGLGGALNIASQIKSVYSTITGGFASLGDSVAFAAQDMGAWLVQNTTGVLNSAGSSLMSNAGAIGTGAGYLGGAMAGYGLGTAISGKYETFGNGNIATVAGTVLGSIFGGPIGGAIGGAIGGLVNRAFGTGTKESTGYGMSGSFSSTGASVENYASWKKDGGWFRSDKSGTDTSPVNAELAKFLNAAVGMTTAATKVYAGAIGLSAAAVDGYTQAINISLQGLDAKGQEEAIGKALSSFSDGMAGVYTGLQALAKDGETAGATLARLGTSVMTVNATFDQLDQTLLAASLSGADAASKLLDAAGGMDAFAQLTTGYYDNFYSDEEKRLNTIKSINAATAGSGLDAATATRASYRALVDAQDVTTESGRKMYLALLGASSAFASISPAADDAAAAIDKIREAAQAALTTAADDLEKAREAELSVLQDTASGLQASIDKFRDFSKSLRDFRDGLKLGALSPLTPAQRYAEAQKQFAAAEKSGDAGKLQSASTALLEASRVHNASSGAYTSDFDRVQSALTLAANQASASADVAQLQLTATQSQLSALTSIDKGVLSVADALAALSSAVLAAVAAGVNPGVENIASLTGGKTNEWVGNAYTSAAGAGAVNTGAGISISTPDGRMFSGADAVKAVNDMLSIGNERGVYDAAKDAGISLASLDQLMGWKPMEAEDWAKANGLPLFERGTNYVGADTLAYLHQGEAVVPRAYNPAAGGRGQARDDGAVLAELRLLRDEVRQLRQQQSAETGAVIAATHTASAKNADTITSKQSRAAWSKPPELA